LAIAADQVGDGPRTFPATLVALDGDRVATGKDFDPATGRVRPGLAGVSEGASQRSEERTELLAGRRGSGVVHLGGDGARGLAARLEGRPFEVIRVEEKPYRRRPYAIHHLDAAAGGGQQTALLLGPDHAHGAAAV
jgi:DNA topoisomerase-1